MFRHSFALLALLATTLYSVVRGTPIAPDEEKVSLSSILEAPEQIQVVPGPGLPSLKSLNLTTVDLIQQAYLKLDSNPAGTLGRRAFCDNTGPLAYRLSAGACASYLEALGDTMCRVEPPYLNTVVMCSAQVGGSFDNFIRVIGSNYLNAFPPAAVQSYCRHVALAVWYTEAACVANSNWMKSGQEFAYGNGNLAVRVIGNWSP